METKERKRNNPNGANQYLADPRQALFFNYYFNPKSETFSNGLRSALKAGFSEEYAKVLTAHMPTWLSDKVKELSMLSKAERNLNEMLDLDTVVPVIGAFGPVIDKKTELPVFEQSAQLLKVKADVSKFVAERVGRIKYGKDRDEGNFGGPVTNNFTQIVINNPRGKNKPKKSDTRNKPDGKAVSRVAGPTGS